MSCRFKFRYWYDKGYASKQSAPWLSHDGQAWSASCCHWGQDEERENPQPIIEQWTGLTDSTGKEIYENDLLAIPNDTLVVRWSNELGRWSLAPNMIVNVDDMTGAVESIWVWADKGTVVGNVHENGALLT